MKPRWYSLRYVALGEPLRSRLLDYGPKYALEWLDRSGSCPLSISVHHADSKTGPDEESDIITMELFKAILALSDRWQDIELIMPEDVYYLLKPMISINNLSLLNTVRLQLKARYETGHDDLEWNSTLLMAPNIRLVSLVGNYTRFSSPVLAAWNNLTHFSCYSPSSADSCFQLLQMAHNLIWCTLRLLERSEPLQLIDIAFLPHLQTLFIITVRDHRRLTTDLLNQISAPKLFNVGFEVPGDLCYDYGQQDVPFPFLHLLEVSTIRKLTIDPRHLSADPEELATILRLSASVTELFIGNRTSSHGGLDHSPATYFNYRPLFRLLTIDADSGDEEPILPNLEVFSASINHTVSDDTILRFIESRLNPSSPLGTKVLISVNIIYPRYPKRYGSSTDDPMPNLLPANPFGVEVELNLAITRSGHESDQFYSLCNGLRQNNDRSWPFEDGVDESIIFLE